MTRVRINLFTSLDGYTSTTDQGPDNPMGADWGRLTAAYAATRTFRERAEHGVEFVVILRHVPKCYGRAGICQPAHLGCEIRRPCRRD